MPAALHNFRLVALGALAGITALSGHSRLEKTVSEVKRYGHISYLIEATPAIIQLYPAMTVYVLATDFDAAQSELAALREELANHDSASLLMNAWVTEHKSQMPWDKAIELISIVTKMPDAEKQRLLCLDDQYELMQQRLTAAEQRNAEYADLLTNAYIAIKTMAPGFFLLEKIDTALKPTESGASE